MIKQIDIANRKGGTGKSEDSIHIAVYLALYKKKRVLLIDEDGSNCTLSTQLIDMENDPLMSEGLKPTVHSGDEKLSESIPEWSGVSSSASIFLDEPVIPYATNFENLHILPAHSSALHNIEGIHRNLVNKNVFEKYKAWRNEVEQLDSYDYIIVDHAPTKTNIGDATLNMSNGLVIPVQAKSSDINGMKVMLQLWTQINQARTLDNPLELLGIVINNYDMRRGAEKMILEDIQNNAVASKYLVPEIITASSKFLDKSYERSLVHEGTVFDLPDSNIVKKKMISVCEHIYRGVNK